jgi:hypothetical protein
MPELIVLACLYNKKTKNARINSSGIFIKKIKKNAGTNNSGMYI